MALAANLTLTYVIGDTIRLRFAVTDSETGVPENLSGYTIRFAARRRKGSAAVVSSPTTASIVVTDAPGGLFTVTVAAAVTVNLTGTYLWQCEVELAGVVNTIGRGHLVFVANLVP